MTIEELASHIQMMNDLSEIGDALTHHQFVFWNDILETHKAILPSNCFESNIPPQLKFEFTHEPKIVRENDSFSVLSYLLISSQTPLVYLDREKKLKFIINLFTNTLFRLGFRFKGWNASHPDVFSVDISLRLPAELWRNLATTVRLSTDVSIWNPWLN